MFNLLKNESFEEFGIAGKQRDYFLRNTRNPDTTISQESNHQRTKNTLPPCNNRKKLSLRPRSKPHCGKSFPFAQAFSKKSKRDLNKELQSVKRQLNSLEEQNKDLADKLTVCLEELQSKTVLFARTGGRFLVEQQPL